MKFNFKQTLKISALCLEKQKVLFLKKYFSSHTTKVVQKMALTVLNFSEGLDLGVQGNRLRQSNFWMFRSAIYDCFCQLTYTDNSEQTKTESDMERWITKSKLFQSKGKCEKMAKLDSKLQDWKNIDEGVEL